MGHSPKTSIRGSSVTQFSFIRPLFGKPVASASDFQQMSACFDFAKEDFKKRAKEERVDALVRLFFVLSLFLFLFSFPLVVLLRPTVIRGVKSCS